MIALDSSRTIESLIPHRPPMQLLNRVIAAGPERLLACTELTPDAPFCSADGVPAYVGLEYLGQAAAAFFSALENEQTSTQPPRPGMLIASRSYTCTEGYFPPSQHLLIDVEPASAVSASGLVKFRGTIYVCGTHQVQAKTLDALCEFLTTAEPFAQGDLSVYLPPFDPTLDPTGERNQQ